MYLTDNEKRCSFADYGRGQNDEKCEDVSHNKHDDLKTFDPNHGSRWSFINFWRSNLEKIEKIRFSIIKLMKDWQSVCRPWKLWNMTHFFMIPLGQSQVSKACTLYLNLCLIFGATLDLLSFHRPCKLPKIVYVN